MSEPAPTPAELVAKVRTYFADHPMQTFVEPTLLALADAVERLVTECAALREERDELASERERVANRLIAEEERVKELEAFVQDIANNGHHVTDVCKARALLAGEKP